MYSLRSFYDFSLLFLPHFHYHVRDLITTSCVQLHLPYPVRRVHTKMRQILGEKMSCLHRTISLFREKNHWNLWQTLSVSFGLNWNLVWLCPSLYSFLAQWDKIIMTRSAITCDLWHSGWGAILYIVGLSLDP